jgi:hypothetical protein
VRKEARKPFFFEKKKQKTFIPSDPTNSTSRVPTNKSSLLLSFKKEGLPSLLSP